MPEETAAKPCTSCGRETGLKCSGCKLVNYCEVSCQRKDWKKHRADCRVYSITDLHSRGKGLVSRRKLNCGELILKEKPLVLVKTLNTPKTIVNHVAELRGAVKSLSDDDKDIFYSLHIANPSLCSKNQGDTRNMGLFHTNAITLKQMDKTEGRILGAAVFPTISLINHSCAPNVAWSFNQGRNEAEVRVIREISEGEEILACYTDPLLQRAEREKILKSKYNFVCDCQVCSLSDESLAENEKLRREITGLKNNMIDIYSSNPQKALTYAKMRLERIERLRKELTEALPQAYMHCYELALADREEEIANIYKSRGKEIATIVSGENSLWSQIK